MAHIRIRLWVVLLALWAVTGCSGDAAAPHNEVSRPIPLDTQDYGKLLDRNPDQRIMLSLRTAAARVFDLREDDRQEQLADWAVAGTLARANLSERELVEVLRSQPLVRDESLNLVANYAYGPGRQIVLPDGTAWLFVSASDPEPRRTIARLADQLRTVQGRIPKHVALFRYRPNLLAGTITVESFAPIEGKELYSSDLGYLTQKIRKLADLEEFLASIDNLTYAGQLDDGVWELGGRRLDNNTRDKGTAITLEDLAVLYQGALWLEQQAPELRAAERSADALVRKFNRLVALANSNVDAYNSGRDVSCDQFDAAAKDFDQELPDAGLAEFTSCASDDYETVQAQIDILNAIEPSLDSRLRTLQQQIDTAAAKAKGPFDLGFSLDPTWRVDGLAADLELLRETPSTLIDRAREIASSSAGEQPKEEGSAAPVAVAMRIDELVEEGARLEQTPESWQTRLQALIDEVNASGTGWIEQLAAFEQLRQELAQSSLDDQGVLFYELLNLIEAQHRVQCARYDGPLSGTSVGMTLFYTDLVAKLWAGLDYHHFAPLDAVAGFRTLPLEIQQTDPNLSQTRLWFGIREDRLARTADANKLLFAPDVTRVFSAGSDPLNPKDESSAFEGVFRVLDWWSNHFAEVAAFEPQFARQNELQKWAILTDWFAFASTMTDLADMVVDRSLRLDTWLREAQPHSTGVELLPTDQWIAEDRECLSLLTSRPFGKQISIQGGVSLGSKVAIDQAPDLDTTLAPHLRHGGLDYGASSNELLTYTDGRQTVFAGKGKAKATTRLTTASKVPSDSTGADTLEQSVVTRDLGVVVQTSASTNDESKHSTETKILPRENGVELHQARAPPNGKPEILAIIDAVERGEKIEPPSVRDVLVDQDMAPALAKNASVEVVGDRAYIIVDIDALKPEPIDPALLQTAAQGARRAGRTDIWALIDQSAEPPAVAGQLDVDAHPLQNAEAAVSAGTLFRYGPRATVAATARSLSTPDLGAAFSVLLKHKGNLYAPVWGSSGALREVSLLVDFKSGS